ncbi:MAG: transglycosylase family protein [Acidimicrobiales bacterium]
MAALFAVVTIALVATYSLNGEEGQEVALDTEGSARFVATPRPTERESTTTSRVEPSDDSTTAGANAPFDFQMALSDIGESERAALDLELLSVIPEDEPAAPTTQAPTTTAPPQTTAPVDAPESSTSMVDETSETTAPDSTDTSAPVEGETTVPEETTTTTAAPAANPGGYVDAGHGVLVPAVLIEIRRCESTHNYQAANPRSTARGAYQFLRSSWAAYGHADRYGVSEAHLATNAQQDEAALLTWQRDGTRPWNASRSCWG